MRRKIHRQRRNDNFVTRSNACGGQRGMKSGGPVTECNRVVRPEAASKGRLQPAREVGAGRARKTAFQTLAHVVQLVRVNPP